MDCMQRRPVDCTCENANKGAAYARACVRLRMGMDAGWTCQHKSGRVREWLCSVCARGSSMSLQAVETPQADGLRRFRRKNHPSGLIMVLLAGRPKRVTKTLG